MTTLPPGLRERVLSAASGFRAPGRPVTTAEAIEPVEAFRRTAAAFDHMLGGLTEPEWATPVLRELDVQGLVGHLIGMERDVRRALHGEASVALADHVASTQPDAERQLGRSTDETHLGWQLAVEETLELVAARDGGTEVELHGMHLPVSALLVVRAFELWTHENDIRRAVGRPDSSPDEPTLALMTALAARLLPRGAEQAGIAGAVDLHLVLTGPGGGTWDVRLGTGPEVEVTLVLDAVDFCRLVADRITPSDIEVHAQGGPRHVSDVLASAAALALD